jgi:F-type H+-transporting ATPase subunit epsilon
MIKFELVTLNGTKLRDEVHEVILPTADGYIAVFAQHAPLVSLAVPGIISIRRKANQPDDLMDHFATHGGVIEVVDDTVRVLVDEADAADEINEKEIQTALENAKKLRSDAKDQVSLDHAQQLIDRSAVRLRVAELRRRKRN